MLRVQEEPLGHRARLVWGSNWQSLTRSEVREVYSNEYLPPLFPLGDLFPAYKAAQPVGEVRTGSFCEVSWPRENVFLNSQRARNRLRRESSDL